MSAGEVDLDPSSFDLEAHEDFGGEVLSVEMVCRRCRDWPVGASCGVAADRQVDPMSGNVRLVVAGLILVLATAAGIFVVDVVLHYNDTTGWTGGASALIGAVLASGWLFLSDMRGTR